MKILRFIPVAVLVVVLVAALLADQPEPRSPGWPIKPNMTKDQVVKVFGDAAAWTACGEGVPFENNNEPLHVGHWHRPDGTTYIIGFNKDWKVISMSEIREGAARVLFGDDKR
jgi:hypothetical protein